MNAVEMCSRRKICGVNFTDPSGDITMTMKIITPFLLYINHMLEDSSIHFYADDSTVNAVLYSGRAGLSRRRRPVLQCVGFRHDRREDNI